VKEGQLRYELDDVAMSEDEAPAPPPRGSKRRRASAPVLDSDDEPAEESSLAEKQLRACAAPSQRKRRKASSEDEEDAEDAHPAPLMPAQVAAEAVASLRRAEVKWGPPPRNSGAGQVKKIELHNFSCHSHFEIEFNSNVTIVHGANGSGKTSIIDALQICLGAKGQDTSRATKLSRMIKHGCSQAIAKVRARAGGSKVEMTAAA